MMDNPLVPQPDDSPRMAQVRQAYKADLTSMLVRAPDAEVVRTLLLAELVDYLGAIVHRVVESLPRPGFEPAPPAPGMHWHVYPVDPSLTPEQAWEEIRLMGRRTTFTPGRESWSNRLCDGSECDTVEDARST